MFNGSLASWIRWLMYGAMLAAAIIPAGLIIVVKDMAGLADLYAIGVVGAIATNLGASATDRKLGLVRWERILMLVKGRIHANGTPDEIFSSSDPIVHQFVNGIADAKEHSF